jgi:hypothetical protein
MFRPPSRSGSEITRRPSLSIVTPVAVLGASTALADDLFFDCTWDAGGTPYAVSIAVDSDAGRAARSDGGSGYDVLLVEPEAIWLRIDRPGGYASAVQVIGRDRIAAANWADIQIHGDGRTSTIVGGTCAER